MGIRLVDLPALTLTAILSTALAACSSDVQIDEPDPDRDEVGDPEAEPASVYDVARSLPSYSVLVAAVDKAGLTPALRDPDASLTVFAPDDEAFAELLGAIGKSSLDDLSAEQLRPILLYHVLGETVDAEAASALASDGERVTTLGGQVQLAARGGAIELDGAALVDVPDVEASNGVIHGIDVVLLPSITDLVTTNPDFTALAGAIDAADGAEGTTPKIAAALDAPAAAGAYTVFAPSNAAFSSLGAAPAGQALTSVLLYHVVGAPQPIVAAEALSLASPTTFGTLLGNTPGAQIVVSAVGGPPATGVQVDDAGSDEPARVVAIDHYTANGVVHVIDKVLLPE